MERVTALVVATLASVQAFGTAGMPIDKPEASPGPIRIDTQTESFEDSFEDGDDYALSIKTEGREWCRCGYEPMALPNGKNGKKNACTAAADWLKANGKANIKDGNKYVKKLKGPKPNKNPPQDAEEAYGHLKGCRYRANKKTVYYNTNNDADGFEGPPVPHGNYKNICVPAGGNDPSNPLCGQQEDDPSQHGWCDSVSGKTPPVGHGCCTYDNNPAQCPDLEPNVKVGQEDPASDTDANNCDWVSTPKSPPDRNCN
jgi:hypothetical protein